jgi:GDPmannose 4,6-dehydratase
MKKALITGITGQDGSYLAELLLAKGYEVHGLIRRTSMFNRGRIEHIIQNPELSSRFITHYGDMTDGSSLMRVLSICQPDEIYNLAAQSHVQISFLEPEYTAESDAVGVLRLLEAVRSLRLASRIYQASTSELYGETTEMMINEATIFNPVSPYAAAKIYAHYISNCYKKAYGLYVCNGILFNHESPRRGENFVSRKITLSLAEILSGTRAKLMLGNLDAVRDWGYAGDYVEAMWLMLQQDEPEDYVIATGESHSVREFAEMAFKLCGIDVQWTGEGVNEKGIDRSTGRELICCSPKYYRPVDVPYLRGDHTKARTKLGWNPKVSFRQLVELMVYSDLVAHNVVCPFTPSFTEGGIGKGYRL